MHKQKVIAVVGPTASGKTALGIALAQRLGGEVISADSRQIYRGMDTIAATPSTKEMKSVPHHMLRIADPKRQYSAGTYVKAAEKLIREISKRGKIPIIVGGTGFYADALLRAPLPEVKPDKKLRRALEKKTSLQLFAQLKKLDPKRAAEVDPRNKVRLIRSIEIAKALGSVPKRASETRFETLWLGLSPAPEKHLKAIRDRTQEHLRTGALTEARGLCRTLSKKRYDALGTEFRLLRDHLDKKITKKELAEELERWERKYAKRQMRWHRRNTDIHWVGKTEALKLAKAFLKN